MSNSEFTIDIIANDEASAVISNVQMQLNGVGTSAATATGGMTTLGTATAGTTTSMMSNISAITQVTGGFTSMAFSIVGLERSYTLLDRANIMVERDTLAVEKATTAYNDSLVKLGPDAQKTQEALQTLTIDQQKLAMDTDRASIAQQNFDLQIVQMGAVGIPMFLMGLTKMGAAYDALQAIGGKITALFSGEAAAATEATTAIEAQTTAVTGLTAAEEAAPSVAAAAAAPVGVEAAGGTAATGLAGTAAALAPVAAGAAAAGLELVGMVSVLSDVKSKTDAGTLSLKDATGALVSVASPVNLITQGLQALLAQLGLLPATSQTVGTQTVSNFQNLYSKLVGGSIWPETWTALQTVATKSSALLTTGIQTSLVNWATLFAGGGGAIDAAWQDAMNVMVSSTEAALQTIYSEMQSKLNAIVAAVQAAKQKISSGSIWPDMLDEMVAQTHAGMAAIQGEFAQGFESPHGIIPTIQAGGQAATAAAPSAAPAAGAPGSQAITLPINVYLDGQQIQTFMEKRMVDTLRQNAGRSKRSGRV